MSKGSRQRPTDLEKFRANYDAIFRKPDLRTIEDAKAEDDAFKLIEEQNKKTEKD